MFERLKHSLARAVIRNSGIGSSRELQEFLFGKPLIESETGMDVTPDTAMRLSTVYACVRVLSEDIAKLPLKVYKRIPKGKQEITDPAEHWLVKLLRKPNPWQTGFEFREMQQAHIELSGNFYGIKTMVGKEVREILPIAPWRMQVIMLPNWTIKYMMTGLDGIPKQVPTELVYHVRGLTLDGVCGLSPIAYQRDTVGLGMALRKFGNMAFKNGATFSGVLQHPGLMEDQAWKRLKESFEQSYSGLTNAHKMLLLEEGTTFQATGMTLKDAQYLDARKYSRSEIAGIYRVPLHLIQDLDRATFSNIESQGRDYVQNGLLSRVVRLEQRMIMSLLSPADSDTIFVEHLLDVLQRGDFQTRMQGYQTAVGFGWITRNEVRAMENLNPGPKELDVFMVPGMYTSAEQLGQKFEPPAEQVNDPDPLKSKSSKTGSEAPPEDDATKNRMQPIINVTVPAPQVTMGPTVVHNHIPVRVKQKLHRDEDGRVTEVEDQYDHQNGNGRSHR